MPYLLKIRRYGEDTDTVRSEGEDTVEYTKIRSKIPRYGEDTVISQDLLMFRVRTPNLRTIPHHEVAFEPSAADGRAQ